ncbi:hypothetical protein BDZ90DRAFT_29546 [Jaminaea rosea]|uniref:t-SNARE coiled-coil homology domain-containing protein n=1 Tax=Jaminaea rosea TaxID=1569628 RepID=A0A316V075_9BASI|nr:hypothetical protein BDZ90DRAFT_29546 [Jaminaea rosea]PWN30949.1 hypothetical protein BDZ90DRAFT_29546 [Jaminaea rosea]
MSQDPFHTFSSSLRSSLSSAHALSQSYTSARTSSDHLTAHDRLADAIEALRSDVADVRQSVNVVQSNPARFGVDESEVDRRKEFLRDCEEQMRRLEEEVDARSRRKDGETSIDMNGAHQDDGDDDAYTAWEQQHQSTLMSRQDTILSSIGTTLSSIQRQATHMGSEIVEQTELIGALDSEVESSQTRLGRAMGKMDEMVRRGDDRLGGWCVWLLVIALFFLLLVAILI